MRPVPPYALDAPEFPFRALAALAGRAALGGTRELVLGLFVGARLVDGVVGPHPLPSALRRTRATAAKNWLSALALPATSRVTLGRLMESTAGDDRTGLRDAWEAAVSLVGATLDGPARTELRKLSAALSTSVG